MKNKQKRWDWILVVTCLVVALVCAPRAVSFMNEGSPLFDALLPRDLPSLNMKRLHDQAFSHRPELAFILEGDAVPAEALVAGMRLLGERYGKESGVARVQIQRIGFDYLDIHKWLYLDLEELEALHDRVERRLDEEKLGGFYIDFSRSQAERDNFVDLKAKYAEDYEGPYRAYFTDDTHRRFAFYLVPDVEELAAAGRGIAGDSRLLERVRRVTAGLVREGSLKGMTLYMGGALNEQVAAYERLRSSVWIAFLACGLAAVCLLSLRFRSWQLVSLHIALILQALSVIFALASLWIESLSLSTACAPPFLFALGLYLTLVFITSDARSVLPLQIIAGGIAMGLGLACFSFRGFRDWGILLAVTLSVYGAVLVWLVPAYLRLSPRLSSLLSRFERAKPAEGNPSEMRTPTVGSRYMLGAVILVLLAGILRLQVDYDRARLLGELPQEAAAGKRFESVPLPLDEPAVFVFEARDVGKGKAQAEAIKKAVVSQKWRKGEAAFIDRFRSYDDLTPIKLKEKREVLAQIAALLDDNALGLANEENRERLRSLRVDLERSLTATLHPPEVPTELKRQFLGRDGLQLGLVYPKSTFDIGNGKDAIAWWNEVRVLYTEEGRFWATGGAIVFADALTLFLKQGKILCLFGLAALAFFAIFVQEPRYRGVRCAGAVALSVAASLGMMGWLAIPLSFYTVPAIFLVFIFNFITLFSFKRRTSSLAWEEGLMGVAVSLTAMIFVSHAGLRSGAVTVIIGVLICRMVLGYLRRRDNSGPIGSFEIHA